MEEELTDDHRTTQAVADPSTAGNMDRGPFFKWITEAASCDVGQSYLTNDEEMDNSKYDDDEEIEYDYWDSLDMTFHEYQDDIGKQKDDFYYTSSCTEESGKTQSSAAEDEPLEGRKLRRVHLNRFMQYWVNYRSVNSSLTDIPPRKLSHPN